MKHTRDMILNALKVIKEECENAETCKNCPFGSLDGFLCQITETDNPSGWTINDYEEVWKGLV